MGEVVYKNDVDAFVEEVALSNKDYSKDYKPYKVLASKKEGNQEVILATVGSDFGSRYGLREEQTIEVPEPTDFYNCVKMARDIYFKEGIVRTAVDMMIDFAATGFENDVEGQKRIKKWYDNHCKYADMDSVVRHIFWELFITGDAFMYRGDRSVVKSGPDKGAVYYPYTILNPLKTSVEGSLLFDANVFAVDMNEELRHVYNLPPRLQAEFKKKIPKEFRKIFNKDGSLNNTELLSGGKLILNPAKTSRISRNRQPYQRYSVPFLRGCFEPVAIKRRLREMDLSTAEGMINSIVLIKVGTDEHPATPGQMRILNSVLMTSAKSLELLWNHAIEIEFLNPDWQALQGEKYKEVDNDILNSLGVPSVLISGQGSFATAWTSIVSLVERLNRARNMVARWLEEEYRVIAEEENFKTVPHVRFKSMNLRDDKVFKNILQNLYDRGLLDPRTILEEAEFDPDTVEARKEEYKDKMDIFEPPYTPFSGMQTPKPPKPKANTPGGAGRPTTDVAPKTPEKSKPSAPKGEEGEIGGK